MRRVNAWLRVIGLLLVEVALFALVWFSGPVMGTVGWSNLHGWLANSTPQGAVTALIRVFGLVGSGWVLATSLLWVLAGVAGLRGVQVRFGRLTLPFVRRLLQPVASLSMLASVAMSSGMASASAPPATAHVLAVGSNPLQQKAPVSEVALPEPVPVSTSAIGRHIAHPGVIDHRLPGVGLGAAAASAPSETNGFAGLKPGTKVYVVQPGDCLSVIAEEHLGDWRLDLVIDEMNRGRLQPDGRALVDDHWIYPGWVLVMPHDATGVITVPAHGHGSTATPRHVRAKGAPGSEAHHTSAPATATPTTVAAVPTTVVPTTAAPVPTTASQVPTTVVPTTAAPVTPTTAAQQPAPPASVPVHASHPGAQDHDVTTSSRPVVPLPAELLGAGILAAGLVALLKKLDNVRKGRRRLGQRDTLQRSGDEARAELAARVGSDDTALLTVDRGLRLFGSLVRQEGLAVPEVLAVELTWDSLVVLFEGVPPQAPSPWSPGPDGMSWLLDRAVPLPESDEVAPFPALVSLGESEDEARSRVLVNLEAAGVLAFAGDEQVSLEAAASMAVELATVPWAQECRIYLYGLGRPEGLGVAEPVSVVEDLADVVGVLEATAAATRQAVGNEAGARSLGELRLKGDDPVDLGPAVVICAAPADAELLGRLSELADDPASGLVAVLTTDSAAHQWLVEVGSDGVAELGPLARRVRLQRLSMPVFDAVQSRLEHALPPEADQGRGLSLPQDGEEAHDGPGCNLAADWWEPPPGSVVDEQDGDDELEETITDDDVRDELVAETAVAEVGEEEDGSGPATADGGDVIELGETEPAGADVGAPARSVPSLVRLVPELVRPQGLAPILAEQGASVVVQVLHGFPRIWNVEGNVAEEIVVPRLRSLEAIVYLALRQDAPGVSSHRLAEALHPEKVKDGRKANDQTFATEMTTARKALGVGPDGTPLLPAKAATGGKFLLSEKVITDWSVLRDLLHQAEESGDALSGEELYQLVSKAFSLVGDEAPFAEVRRRSTDARRRPNGGGEAEHWRWVDIEHSSIDDDVADTAAWTAKFANEYGRHHEARVAARLGLKVSPVREDLCEELLKAENALGGARAVQKAWDDIERSFEDHAEPYDVVPSELRHTYNSLVTSWG